MCQWRTCRTARTCRNPDTCPTDSGRSSSAPPPMKPYPIRNPCTSRPCLHGTSLRGSPHTKMTQPWRSDRSRISCTIVRYTAYCKHLRGKANRSCHHTSRGQSTGQEHTPRSAQTSAPPSGAPSVRKSAPPSGTPSVPVSESTRTPSRPASLPSTSPTRTSCNDRTRQRPGTCPKDSGRSSSWLAKPRCCQTRKPSNRCPCLRGTCPPDNPCTTTSQRRRNVRSRMQCNLPRCRSRCTRQHHRPRNRGRCTSAP